MKNESAHIGDELLNSSNLTELDRKCLTILQTVNDGDFTLEEALNLYQVSVSDFSHFLTSQFHAYLNKVTARMGSPKIQQLFATQMIIDFAKVLITIDKNSPEVIRHYNALSLQIQEDKI